MTEWPASRIAGWWGDGELLFLACGIALGGALGSTELLVAVARDGVQLAAGEFVALHTHPGQDSTFALIRSLPPAPGLHTYGLMFNDNGDSTIQGGGLTYLTVIELPGWD